MSSTKKKEYKIPCSWEMCGHINVEAESLEAAILIAGDEGLPSGDYVDSSFVVNMESLDELMQEIFENKLIAIAGVSKQYANDAWFTLDDSVRCFMCSTEDAEQAAIKYQQRFGMWQ